MGGQILSACKNNWHSTVSNIQHKWISKKQSMVEIELPEDIVCASSNQYFYNVSVLKWVPAKDLIAGESLLNIDGKPVLIQRVNQFVDQLEFDSIEVAKFHNYFVSKNCVLVHNEVCTVGIALTWAFGSGAIEYVGAQLTFFVAGLIGAKLFKGSDNKYDIKPEINVDGWNNKGSGYEPDDDNDDETSGSADLGIDVDDVLFGAKRGNRTNGPSKIFEKKGNFSDAQRDFNKLKPTNVKNIDNWKVGTLKDGRVVNVRSWSKDGRPTLEVRRGNRSIKVRYGAK